MEKEFNLLYEPWICVREKGEKKEVSLLDLFEHDYDEFANDHEAQTVAILRQLMAIMYTVMERNGISWKEVKDAGKFPSGVIRDYLESQKEKFYLFHSKYPFGQEPLAKNGTKFENGKLIMDLSQSGNKARLFQSRKDTSMSYAEAARWILAINLFDDASAKPKINKSKVSPGPSWGGKFGHIYPIGKTIFETVMLNLSKTPASGQTPTWERNSHPTSERIMIPFPKNEAEFLTTKNRFLLLNRTAGKIDGFRELSGYFFDPDDIEGAKIERNRVMFEKPKVFPAGKIKKWGEIMNSNFESEILKNIDDCVQILTLQMRYGSMSSSIKDIESGYTYMSIWALDNNLKIYGQIIYIEYLIRDYIDFRIGLKPPMDKSMASKFRRNLQDELEFEFFPKVQEMFRYGEHEGVGLQIRGELLDRANDDALAFGRDAQKAGKALAELKQKFYALDA